jgi:integrase
MSDVATWREWKRENPAFPLSVAGCGQWVKKVNGKFYYFGVLREKDEALLAWLREKDYLLAGVTPPTCEAGLTVAGLLKSHLEDVDERIAAGKLSAKTRRDYLPLARLFTDAGLLGMPVNAMKPQHFALLQRTIEKTGRSLRTQKNIAISIRSIFNWGGPDGMGLCDRVVYGPRFVAPSSESIEVQQEEAGRIRFFDRELILAALEAAKPAMKVAILLGINCAFYPGDSIAITLDHLHLDAEIPYHDFRRVKTKHRRMAALWPETVAAITAYRDEHRRPLDCDERRLLLTQYREPYTKAGEARKLIETFGRLVAKVGSRSPGVGLGSLRHTYATVVDCVPDQSVIDLTMGHVSKGLQKRVYRQYNLDELKRLQTVADTARTWLYGVDSTADPAEETIE